MHISVGVCRVQQVASDPRELELQTVSEKLPSVGAGNPTLMLKLGHLCTPEEEILNGSLPQSLTRSAVPCKLMASPG